MQQVQQNQSNIGLLPSKCSSHVREVIKLYERASPYRMASCVTFLSIMKAGKCLTTARNTAPKLTLKGVTGFHTFWHILYIPSLNCINNGFRPTLISIALVKHAAKWCQEKNCGAWCHKCDLQAFLIQASCWQVQQVFSWNLWDLGCALVGNIFDGTQGTQQSFKGRVS